MGTRKYVCKRRPGDGWGCVNLYCGTVKVAIESCPPYNTRKGKFCINFLLPEMNSIYGDNQTDLRSAAVRLCEEWFVRTDVGALENNH